MDTEPCQPSCHAESGLETSFRNFPTGAGAHLAGDGAQFSAGHPLRLGGCAVTLPSDRAGDGSGPRHVVQTSQDS